LAIGVPFPLSQDREDTMIAILNLATLAATTLFAAAAAVALNSMLLKAMFVLMRPATARRISAPPQLVRGTAQLGAYVQR
jgi:hypothetical protein